MTTGDISVNYSNSTTLTTTNLQSVATVAISSGAQVDVTAFTYTENKG